MALDLERDYAVDLSKEVEGVWVQMHGAWFKVARSNNDEFQRAFNQLPQETQDAIQQGTLSEEESENLFADLMARTIVKDWQGLTMGGKEVPYSEAKAREILSQRKFKDFRQDLWRMAEDRRRFREDQLEEDVGNSSADSGGSSSTGTPKPKKPSGSGKKSTASATSPDESAPS